MDLALKKIEVHVIQSVNARKALIEAFQSQDLSWRHGRSYCAV